MTRTATLEPEHVPADSKATLEAFTKNIGFTPNMMAAFAHSPIAFNAWAALLGSLSKALDVKTRDSIGLAVSEVNGCNYCLTVHSFTAEHMARLSADEIILARQGHAVDPKRDAALRARALITLASSYVRRDAFEKADEAYSEALALRGDAKDPEALGIAYLGHGVVLAERGKFDEANTELGRARIELESAGDPLGVAQVDVNLGDFQLMRHRPADALPILRMADAVTALIVDHPPQTHEAERYLQAWFDRQGCKGSVQRLPTGGDPAQEVILRHAGRIDADLIVMGLYGHSRLREFILGGVSREMLEHSPLPLFLSH